MEILLLGIYGFFAWLIFFKFKWLPWNTTSQVITYTIPVVLIGILILFLNLYAPSSHDVRVINYTVEIVPSVTGQVIEVPVEPNSHVKKGDVLFRIDPTPFQNEIKNLEATIPNLAAKIISAQYYNRELSAQLNSASDQINVVNAKYELAKKRYSQTKALAESGAGTKFDFEQAAANLKDLEAQLGVSKAAKTQIIEKMSAKSSTGELSEVAQARANLAQAKSQIEQAKWRLEQTVYRAPADGRVINLQLREGAMAVQLPLKPVMSFVEDEQYIVALYEQNELRMVEPGNEAEIALRTHPNQIIKCEVEKIVWATSDGQVRMNGIIPQTGEHPPAEENRFAVRLKVTDHDKDTFLAAGAVGAGAIYTEHGKIIHLVRKVIVRVSTKMDWLILKLH
ncbi:HlyD family secretion protein [Flavobacterium agrisoli]|uniref:HlyD family secretion protein n=1 Tax=Flavobacterium agrisoli TaxID=2793066 RepID=A0A934UJM8_9FLAO|nr:HlyD family secretion protein [Flavobacterium agrisoli]MBK0369734.1 HlyD family secretion protein [Flavobacterium agrisoli]